MLPADCFPLASLRMYFCYNTLLGWFRLLCAHEPARARRCDLHFAAAPRLPLFFYAVRYAPLPGASACNACGMRTFVAGRIRCACAAFAERCRHACAALRCLRAFARACAALSRTYPIVILPSVCSDYLPGADRRMVYGHADTCVAPALPPLLRRSYRRMVLPPLRSHVTLLHALC